MIITILSCHPDIIAHLPPWYSSLGVFQHVPHTVPHTTPDHHGGLHPHLLPPLGCWPYWGCHAAAAGKKVGLEEEDNQDALPGGGAIRHILASSLIFTTLCLTGDGKTTMLNFTPDFYCRDTSESQHSSALFFISHILAMSNVTCNPFVYFWLNKVC